MRGELGVILYWKKIKFDGIKDLAEWGVVKMEVVGGIDI